MDHASQAELQAKYRALGTDVSAIESVDTVWTGGALHDAVPRELAGGFTRLIASHVIEHIPDLVSFFTSASRLLAPDGIVALAVPDRRCCFDFFKPLTLTGDVLEAHRLGRMRHAPVTVWNDAAYSVLLRGQSAWGFESVPNLGFSSSLGAAARDYAAYTAATNAPYADFHAWHFTPARFHLVMLELGQIGVIEWEVVDLETAGGEFLCTLRRGVKTLDAESLRRQRLQWLYRGLADDREQIDRALGDRDLAEAEVVWGASRMLRKPVDPKE